MSEHFSLLMEGLNIDPILEELDAAPDLWDQFPLRRTMPDSPHREMQDIWLRYADPMPPDAVTPFESKWWDASYRLPALMEMTNTICDYTGAHELGGVLVTRLPAGRQIYPHHDRGPWHAEHHNFKVYLCLASNEGCINYFAGDSFVMKPGDLWRFDNQVNHMCLNNGDTVRISAIISMRVAECSWRKS